MRYLAEAKGFVFMSLEDFGIAPLEAQACGTQETALEDETGVFVQEQSTQALTESIERFEMLALQRTCADLQCSGVAGYFGNVIAIQQGVTVMLRSITILLIFGAYLLGADITLCEAYERSLSYESGLKATAYEAEATIEERHQVEARLYPQLNASGAYTFRQYKENTYLKRGITERYTGLTLSATQSLFDSSLYARLSSSEARSELSRLGYVKKEQDLALQVVDAYIRTIMLKSNSSLAQEYVESSRVKHDEISNKYEMRLANKMDYLESKISLDKAVLDKHRIDNEYELSKLLLKRLTGIEITAVNSIEVDRIDLDAFPDLDAIAIERNVDIDMAKTSLQMRKAELRSANNAYYPTLDLSASYTQYPKRSENFEFQNDSKITFELRLPLYSGGALDSKIQQERLMLKSSQEALSNQEKDTRLRLDEQMLKYALTRKDIVLAMRARESAALFYESVESGYEHGLKSLFDLQEARAKLFESNQAVLESLYGLINAYVEIVNLTKGLESDNLQNLSRTVAHLGSIQGAY